MLIIVRPTSGVQSSEVVCYCARVFVIIRRIIIVVVVVITGDTHRHRCCSSCRGRWNNERRRRRMTKEKKRLRTGKLCNSHDLFRYIVSILTTDRQRLDDRLAPHSLPTRCHLNVHRNTHFHTVFPPYV